MTRSFLFVGSALLLAACAPSGGSDQPSASRKSSAGPPSAIQPGPDPFGWPIVNSAGARVGTVATKVVKDGVRIAVEVAGMQPGQHAVHIHQNAKCETPHFKSAGSHWNWTNKKHGHDNPKGHHAGDLGNLVVGADGRSQQDFLVRSSDWDSKANGGWPLIVHERADDEKTDPSGNSGERIACGVFYLRRQ
jgi:Cu-Zn family superoxide dismutase